MYITGSATNTQIDNVARTSYFNSNINTFTLSLLCHTESQPHPSQSNLKYDKFIKSKCTCKFQILCVELDVEVTIFPVSIKLTDIICLNELYRHLLFTYTFGYHAPCLWLSIPTVQTGLLIYMQYIMRLQNGIMPVLGNLGHVQAFVTLQVYRNRLATSQNTMLASFHDGIHQSHSICLLPQCSSYMGTRKLVNLQQNHKKHKKLTKTLQNVQKTYKNLPKSTKM